MNSMPSKYVPRSRGTSSRQWSTWGRWVVWCSSVRLAGRIKGFLFRANKLCVPESSVRLLLLQESHSGGLMGHFSYGHDGGGAAQFQDSTKLGVILFMSLLFLINSFNNYLRVGFGPVQPNQIGPLGWAPHLSI